MDIFEARQKLIKFLYSESGRAINARFKEDSIVQANLKVALEVAINEVDKFLPELSFPHKLRTFCKDQCFRPHCKTCGIEYIHWSSKHNAWSKYCSQKCTQNSPETLEKNKIGQSNVQWDLVVEKRKATNLKKYGVESFSSLYSFKSQRKTSSIEFWKNEDNKKVALENKKKALIEKYGVDHISKVQSVSDKRGQSIKETKRNKNETQKLETVSKYRDSRLGEKSSMLYSYDFMYDAYVVRQCSVLTISKEIGCAEGSVVYALNNLGIDYNPQRERHKTVSDAEKSLYEFILSIEPSAVQSYRDGKELDVFIESKKIGFEFNGCYWHSEACKSKTYHQEKVDYFANKGIRVVQIWEDQWQYNRIVVENFIKNLLGVSAKRIGARNCVVKEISNQQSALFLDKNHLQGSVGASVYLGCFDKTGVLKSVMTFTKRERGSYELTRFANENVVGSFSKMLHYFLKNYPHTKIYSFADLQTVDQKSNVYSKNGFVAQCRIPPDYQYYNPRTDKREHKFKWRKKTFGGLGLCIKNLTEKELALQYGLLRCYDSGKIKYILNFS